MSSTQWLFRGARMRALSLAMLFGASAVSAAEAFPSKSITIIVNGGAGSLPDNFARPLADRLRQALGQSVVVDNKPGAGGMVALQTLKASPADGHTLAIITNAHAVWNPFVFPKLTYDPQADLLPVSPLAIIPMALAVNPKIPAQSLEQLVALAKSQPGKLNYASSSNGSPPHVLFEMFKEQSGTKIEHIPFKTGPDALTSVTAGDTQIYLAGTSLVEPMVKDGRLRVLAVSPSVKSPTFAGIPSFADKGYKGFEGAVWLGVVTNTGVPAAVVERLNREIGLVLQDPAVQKVIEAQGSLPYHASPAAFAQRIAQDRALWTPILKNLDLKPN
ncbi:Bug family tripartite tricarboxylate transporter substrate binding protein [Ottowia thiooxydans]|uniref:Bug family tripartite tricarboxylate transporter substrate binding protein n=1 Tax=Ottowia thiooxydans TaxID=219182 RepID=UPI0003FFD273|nr:tripartite tricarboxylate transporter substrate binding protein [Ottowia thiooxydans]